MVVVYNSQIHIQIAIIVEHEIIVELSGTPLECPWSRFFERPGGGGRHHLGTIRVAGGTASEGTSGFF